MPHDQEEPRWRCRMNSVTVGVPDVTAAAAFYDFGLTETKPGVFATPDGGNRLRLARTPIRQLISIGQRRKIPTTSLAWRRSLVTLGVLCRNARRRVYARSTRVRASPCAWRVAPPLVQEPAPATSTTARGGSTARGARRGCVADNASGSATASSAHVVFGSLDIDASNQFFTEGIGFKVSDTVKGLAPLLALLEGPPQPARAKAPIPVSASHVMAGAGRHSDQPGRARVASAGPVPARVGVWPPPHQLELLLVLPRDPAGNFSEYYSDLDVIIGDQLWKPAVFEAYARFTRGTRRHPRRSCARMTWRS